MIVDAETRRVDLDGVTYRLRPWAYKDGRRWLYQLSKLAIGLAGAEGSDQATIAALLDRLGEDTFEALCDTCERYTDVVHVEGGNERITQLSAVSAVHMKGRYVVLAMLLRLHLEAEFAPFFGRLGEVLAGLAATEQRGG